MGKFGSAITIIWFKKLHELFPDGSQGTSSALLSKTSTSSIQTEANQQLLPSGKKVFHYYKVWKWLLHYCMTGTGGRSLFDRLILLISSRFKRASTFLLVLIQIRRDNRAHFCLSWFKLDKTSKMRMAQSRKILGSSRLILQDSRSSRLILPIFSHFKQASTLLHVSFQNYKTRMAKILIKMHKFKPIMKLHTFLINL